MDNLFRKNYLNNKSLENLKIFKYNSENESIVYNNLISPFLDNYFMKILPRWIAPNLITILSFLFNFITFIMILLETKFDYDKRLSRICIGLKAFSHLIYIILDNADGKQARRTKTSSPLGLLLDHGLDALTTTIVAFNCSFMTSTGNNTLTSYYLFFGLYWGYFICNYEEYRTGKMFLGKINGPDEGNFIVFLSALISFIFGPEFWQIKIYSDFRIVDLLVLFVFIGSILCTIEALLHILKGKTENMKEIEIFLKDSFWIMNAMILPYLTCYIDRNFYFRNMSFFLFLISIIFLRIGVEVLINIVCKRKMIHNSLIILIIILWYISLFLTANGLILYFNIIFSIIYILSLVLFLELLKFLISVTIEIRDYLGVSLIRIDLKD